MSSLITCSHVSKKYDKDFFALKDVNLSFEKGKIYGLIGRNGAGKTTLLKALIQQLFPTNGEIRLTDDIKVCLSRDYQHFFLKQKCSAILQLAREMYPKWDKDFEKELIKQLQFPYKKVYEKISRGNQNMLSIIIALCSKADIILLDEPYTGLDPVNRKIIYQHIIQLNEEEDITFIISSHLITELENMLQQVIMIDSGQVIIDDELEAVKSKAFRFTGVEEILNKELKGLNIIAREKLGNQLIIDVYDFIDENTLGTLEKVGIHVSLLDLQELMVGLTMKGGALI
ncbi:ATP-binding cassette domain-containing protein [Vallitalea okinawensis]|uniref:ATP-binding cassette domain-containing protein n=1 Tax=Vallitalea okinawensis TaxID=2078660 RepID=UPI000CFA8370|nr:ABC transporter ATP-binding protein [Vallitalea okinawensis]